MNKRNVLIVGIGVIVVCVLGVFDVVLWQINQKAEAAKVEAAKVAEKFRTDYTQSCVADIDHRVTTAGLPKEEPKFTAFCGCMADKVLPAMEKLGVLNQNGTLNIMEILTKSPEYFKQMDEGRTECVAKFGMQGNG